MAHHRATDSGSRIASDLGASSPTTMCRNEITEKATTKDTPWISSSEVTPRKANTGSSRLAKAGSPTQPRPSEARVMPSWQADR